MEIKKLSIEFGGIELDVVFEYYPGKGVEFDAFTDDMDYGYPSEVSILELMHDKEDFYELLEPQFEELNKLLISTIELYEQEI